VLAESLPAYDIELWRPSVDDAQRLSTRLAPFLVVPANELVDASDRSRSHCSSRTSRIRRSSFRCSIWPSEASCAA
jgi:hypothetical protein